MKDAALLVIDVQKGLDDPLWGRGITRRPKLISGCCLLSGAIMNCLSFIYGIIRLSQIHHCRPELPGNEIKDEARPLPGEKQFSKTVNSAFIGTGLEQYLHEQNISSLVIVGLTTDHCVSASTRMAADLGFEVTLVADATAAHERIGYDGVLYSGEEIHKINLVSLDGEFCTVRSTAEVLARLRVS